MLRNLDNVSGKFLMYSRFIQTFLDKQLDGLPTHKEKYDVSFHTKKVFANMKRIGKGFSGKKTPLFPTMVRPNQVQMGKCSAKPTDTQHTPTFDMSLPKLKKTQKPSQPKRKTTKVPQPSESTDIAADEAVRKEGVDSLVRATTTASSLEAKKDSGVNTPQSDENSLKHIGLTKIYTTLQKKVIDLEDELKRTKTTQQTKIDGLERRVKKLEKKHSTHDDVTHDDEGIEDVGFEEVVEVVTTGKMIIDIVVDVAQVTTTIVDVPVSAAETIVTTTPTITAESTKTNVEKVEDDKESEELKKCLEIIPDDGYDVTIDATHLSVKTPIVDYKIYKEGKKNYFKIFRANGNSQMYLTFSKLLKNFDREDLEVLWRLVKDKFVKTMPVDHMDSFLMHNLKTMFKHHVEAFGKHLEEKHMTWARFGKKLDKDTTLQARDFHSDAFTKNALKVKLEGYVVFTNTQDVG
nr:hypothetical protein [Tanacetum cinerariifolium]